VHYGVFVPIGYLSAGLATFTLIEKQQQLNVFSFLIGIL